MLHGLHHAYKKLLLDRRLKQLGLDELRGFDLPEGEFIAKCWPALKGAHLVVYDIGASIGKYSAIMAQLPNVREVHAFEPVPASFAALQKVAAKNAKIHAYPLGLGSSKGELMMELNECADCSSLLKMMDRHVVEFPFSSAQTEKIPVRVDRLDDFVEERALALPDVLKIDVQGFELQVLEGAGRCLSHVQSMIVEISFVKLYENAPLFGDVFSRISEMGFNLTGLLSHDQGPTGEYLQADAIFGRPTL